MQTSDVWQAVLNAFDPWQPTWEPEKEFQNVQQWYVERYDQPLAFLLNDLLVRARPLKAIVTGHRGSGKSWALANLAQNPEIAERFVVVWLDVERSADVFNVNHVEILFLMGVAAYKAARDLGYRPDQKYLQNLIDSLTTLVREETRNERFGIDLEQVLNAITAVGLGVAATGQPIGAAVAGAAALFRKGFPFFTLGLSSETVQKIEVRPRITEITNRLNELLEHVRQAAGRPVLLMADGLDKIELEQARVVFAESRILYEPVCSIVYTAPILLYYSPDLAAARQVFATYEFPNVHLFYHREDRKRQDERGYEFMREVVRTRLRKLGLDPAEWIEQEALDEMVTMSGGIVRELVYLVHDAALVARKGQAPRVNLEIAREAIYRLRRQYAAGLSLPYLEELKRVHETGRPTGTEICDKLLQNLYILSYANDDLWYAVHPNVLPLIEGI